MVVTETWSRMMKATMDRGLFFLVGSRDSEGSLLSHSFFANDTLIFGDAN